jgi:AcrR family transcriptional regulator
MKSRKSDATRPYRLRARAEGARERVERVMEAAIELWLERWYDEYTLQDIAERSGVSLSTIMRRFGSKEGLLAAVVASDRARSRVTDRDHIAAGDVDGAVGELIEEYERTGDAVMRNLALEERVPAIGEVVRVGRGIHQEFVARVFAPWLPARRGRAYDRRLAQFVVACDVYTWKLLRRDRGLSEKETERAMRDLLDRLMTEEKR